MVVKVVKEQGDIVLRLRKGTTIWRMLIEQSKAYNIPPTELARMLIEKNYILRKDL